MYWAAPTQSFGYYRGSPQVFGGAQAGGGYGPQMAGTGAFAQGQGPTTGAGGWSPTILYMIALIVLEMLIFGFISRRL